MISDTLFEPDFYTIGYEGFDLFGFVEILKKYNIKSVVDIRSVPYSQFSSQFSKSNLGDTLWRDKIYYFHMKELGNPKKFWKEKEWRMMYRDMIVPQLPRLMAKIKSFPAPVCFMCREKNYEDCHRQIVGIELAHHGFMGKHLRKIY